MTNIQQVRISWEGLPGMPGVSTLYRPTSVGDDDNIHDFFVAVKDFIPAGCTLTVQPEGVIIDDASGTLTGAWTHTPTAPISCGGGGTYAQGVGGSIELRTGAVDNGRRVKGRLYLVPFVTAIYGSNGTLDDTSLATLGTAANGLIGAGDELVVWHRPVGGVGGAGEPATSAFVRDRVSVLRSRRA